MWQMFHFRNPSGEAQVEENERKMPTWGARGRTGVRGGGLSKRTQAPVGSGAKATTRPISKTLSGYKFFLYRHLEKALRPCSGTPLAVLILEATSVESLAYRFVPAPQPSPEFHSPELSPKPLHTVRIAWGQELPQFPSLARASSTAQSLEPPVRREAL
jgi:hypothetical protein